MPLGAFLRRILFYAPGTAEPIGYSPAELVVYEVELVLTCFVEELIFSPIGVLYSCVLNSFIFCRLRTAPKATMAARRTVRGSGTATRLETSTAREPSVNVA